MCQKQWYVVHAYSGYENKVATAIEERIKLHNLQDKFGEIMVPTEEVVEMKGGQKRTSERKFFPGYVLVNMELDDESWHLVKDTPRVMGFIGGKREKPSPISEKEADIIANAGKLNSVIITTSISGRGVDIKFRVGKIQII